MRAGPAALSGLSCDYVKIDGQHVDLSSCSAEHMLYYYLCEVALTWDNLI